MVKGRSTVKGDVTVVVDVVVKKTLMPKSDPRWTPKRLFVRARQTSIKPRI